MTTSLLNGGSAVCRWQLGVRLRELRLHAGKTPAHVTAAHLGSGAKISRVENGRHSVTVPDVRAWCQFYGASREVTEAMVLLALGTAQQDWSEGGTVPDWFKLFAEMERTAVSVEMFEPWFVAGPLQTERYARALIRDQSPAALVEKRVRFRMQRQQAARNITAIIGETALHMTVGSADVLAEQIEHLRSTTDAAVRILPFEVGAPSTPFPFSLLTFEGEDPSCVYVETDVGRYSGRAADWQAYRAKWDDLVSRSVPIGEWSR